MNKHHIARLSTDIDYAALLPEDVEGTEKLAVSIPLFSSGYQHHTDFYKKEYFQQVHCKGAVWTALSLLHNTDLGEKGVQVYFHVEAKAEKLALAVFKQMNVPTEYIRVMDLSDMYTASVPKSMKNVQYGKIFMCLNDTELSPDIWLMADSDNFACTRNEKIFLYDTLLSAAAAESIFVYECILKLLTKAEWIDRIYEATGQKVKKGLDIVKDFCEIEQCAYRSVGLDINNHQEEEERDKEHVVRHAVRGGLRAVRSESDAADFLRTYMTNCYQDEFLIALYAQSHPVLSLNETRVFFNGIEYVQEGRHYEKYWHHVIFEAHNSNPYFNKFYRDVTRNIPLAQPKNLTNFQEVLGRC